MSARRIFGVATALIVCAVLGLAVAQEASSPPALAAGSAETDSSPGAGVDASSTASSEVGQIDTGGEAAPAHARQPVDYWSMVFVFALATFIGIGVIARVSRLLHTPLMSITNAISAIAVVGSIIVTGSNYPKEIRFIGAVALFASMTNIVSGFLITDRMLKMFKTPPKGGEKK